VYYEHMFYISNGLFYKESLSFEESQQRLGLVSNSTQYSNLDNLSIIRILDYIGRPPGYSLVGLIDGFPLTIDIRNSTSFPILFYGGSKKSAVKLCQIIITSTMYLNSQDDIDLVLISQFCDRYKDEMGKIYGNTPIPNLIIVDKSQQDKELFHISNIIKQRLDCREHKFEFPTKLLLIDGPFVFHNNYLQEILAWNLFYGPRVNVFPIVVIDALSNRKLQKWIVFFQTVISVKKIQSKHSNKSISQNNDIAVTTDSGMLRYKELRLPYLG
jgi:hypothetical protein